jgi:succinyl-CoA synthetase beta subunit
MVSRNIYVHAYVLVVICVDAKFNMDPNAEFRQSAIFAMDDETEMDPREADANRCHLNYVGLDGNIACLGNCRFLSYFHR